MRPAWCYGWPLTIAGLFKNTISEQIFWKWSLKLNDSPATDVGFAPEISSISSLLQKCHMQKYAHYYPVIVS